MRTRVRLVMVLVCAVIASLVAGCGGIPDSSSPQPISSFARQGPTNAVPTPNADMDPEAMVRAFLKASASSTDAHAAARKFLTPSASSQWDERGDSIILDQINTYVDERNEDTVRMRVVGDNMGVLRSDGELLPATGQVEATVSLRRVGNRWQIDGQLPDRTLIDRSQFLIGYRSVSVYFTDRTRSNLVADPRWMYAGLDADATTLVNTLIAGPATDVAPAVDSALPKGAALRGPVAPLSGGGVRIELSGIGTLSARERTALAAQIVWTLAGADIAGPYVINADGEPLVAERALGWQIADVRAFDPAVVPTRDVGLNIIRSGALLKVIDSGAIPVGGDLGTSRLLRSAAISMDGSRVAGVVGVAGAADRFNLVSGEYGGQTQVMASGGALARPSFGPDDATIWSVLDGRPIQVMRDENGTIAVTPINAAAVAAVVRGPITEFQVAPDGVRVAMIVAGQVVFGVLASNADGQLSLLGVRIGAYNIGSRAVSLDWASSTTVMVARDSPDTPIVQLSINGTPAVGLLSGNVSPPVTAVAANPNTVYIADQRGVLRLGSTNGQADEYWTEVEPAMTRGTIPVVP